MLFFSYLVQITANMKLLGSFLAIFLQLLILPGIGLCVETNADTVVKVLGKVINSKTKEPVAANIIYEKLPYSDDMGVAQSDQQGEYQMFMIKNAEYNIKVNAAGYNDLATKITVDRLNDGGEFERDFELNPAGTHEIIKLDNLIFSTGKADISASSHEELDGLAKMMHDRSTITVQLEGHTDFAGNAQANLKLSQGRVEEVKKYLVKKGVKKDRILLKAFGGSQPITRDRTDDGRRRNRRVEVRVVD